MFDKLFHHSEKHTGKPKMLKYFCKQRGCSFEQNKDIPPPDHCPICNNPANFEVIENVDENIADDNNGNSNDENNKNENTNDENINEQEKNN